MSSIALRGTRAQSEATLDLARKLLLSTDTENCLLQALETYETQIESLWVDLQSVVENERAKKICEIEASRDRQEKMRNEIEKLERVARSVRNDTVASRIDDILDQSCDEDGDEIVDVSIGARSSAIEEMKATIRRQLNELNSVLER